MAEIMANLPSAPYAFTSMAATRHPVSVSTDWSSGSPRGGARAPAGSAASLPAAVAAGVMGVAAGALGRRSRRVPAGRRGAGRSLKQPHVCSTRAGGEVLSDIGSELESKVSTTGKKTGVLLLNIGTPASTSVPDVRNYLSKFLDDDRVIDITPKFVKNILLQVLLAIRPASSAENYKKIWDPVRGSPLLYHTQDLAGALQAELGEDFFVRIGFAYSEPFVKDALQSMAKVGVDEVLVVPMFPQYASSTTGSILANCYRNASEVFCTPYLSVVPPFFDNPLYLSAMEKVIVETIGPKGSDVDHVLFSFHGLPENQCAQTDDTKQVCLQQPNCCAGLNTANRNCYRAQCFETARLLAERMELPEKHWSIGFQSRLTLRGTIQWIRPYTDEVYADLAREGKTKVAVVAPSFTADCVETLEELGITGQEEFEEAGGEELVIVPCLNSDPLWVQRLKQILLEQIAGAVSSGSSAAGEIAHPSGAVVNGLEDNMELMEHVSTVSTTA